MEAFNSKMVSRIVGVSLRQIQYWDEQGFIRPSVKLAEGRGTKRLYSFSDLVQLKVVKNLTDYGLSLQKIRRCLQYLKRSFPEAEQSLGSLRYLTDGEKLFVLTNDRNKILDVMDRQFVFSLGIGNLVRELSGEVRRIALRPKAFGRRVAGGPARPAPREIRKAEGKKAASA
jgi:DNA-binding transcriptional MerR regulator